MSRPPRAIRRLLALAALAGAVAAPASADAVVSDAPRHRTAPVAASGAPPFPIVGPHRYGDGFGAGRGHGGQDIFAACGTPLVAARPGRIRHVGFEGAAGNFFVLASARGGPDLVYMHLRDAPLVHEGERVEAGRRVGFVGQTGDAWGCHLHFERWTVPGWYRGGHAVDPRSTLAAWDR